MRQAQINGTRGTKEKAPGLLKVLLSPKFVMYLNFLQIFLKQISILSKILQDNNYTVETIVAKVQLCLSKLQKLKDQKLEKVISKDLDKSPEGKWTFRGTKLSLQGVAAILQGVAATYTTRADTVSFNINLNKVKTEA